MVFWSLFCIQLYFICISGSRFFWVQVSQGPGFSGSRPRAWVQGPGPGFSSTPKKLYSGFSKQPSVWEIDMFFMWQSVEILNVFNTLTLKQIFWRKKTFSKNWGTVFQLKALRLKTHNFHTNLSYQKPMLKQIEWWVQNGPITKNRVLPVTTLVFWKFYFILRTSYKDLI